MLVLSCVAGSALAMQDDKGQSATAPAQEKASDPRQELEELGTTLRAAVFSGTLTEEEAWDMYKAVASSLWEDLKGSRAGDAKEAGKETDKESEEADPKLVVLRLSAPKPMQIRSLFPPEFLTRDLAILHTDLELDRNQMMIAGLLVRDYLDAVDLFSKRSNDTRARWRTGGARPRSSARTRGLEPRSSALNASIPRPRSRGPNRRWRESRASMGTRSTPPAKRGVPSSTPGRST
ncbi:MAG: hypothetical protein ACYTGY_15020 [Planctomycetota bacterium]